MKAFIVLLMFSSMAGAQVWDYSDGNAAFSGEITLASPLPDNGTVFVVPTSFEFNAGYGINSPVPGIFQGQGWDGGGTFQFSLANGQITGWNVLLNLSTSSANPSFMTFDLSNTGDSFTQTSCLLNEGCLVTQGSSAPGSWVDPPTSAPEVGSSGALAAFTLMAGWVLILKRSR